MLRFKLDDLDHFVIGQVTSLKTNQDEIFTLATPRAFMDQKRFYIVNNFSSIADSFSELVDVSLVSFVRCDVKLPSFPTLFLKTYTFLSF